MTILYENNCEMSCAVGRCWGSAQ